MRFAVLGDPIAHSKSPAMHAAAYRALALPHTYEAVRATEADLPRLVAELRDGKWGGFNVTVPHKRAVMGLVDLVHHVSQATGAANTLVRGEDGRVAAHNTDVPALARELADLAGAIDWSKSTALVLGAGGAARAAVHALADLGARRIVVRSRSPEKAGAEMSEIVALAGGPSAVEVEPWRASPETERWTRAVVQCTSAGMQGASPGEEVARAVAWDALPEGAVALDVVYAPPETDFLRAAAARGLRRANGKGMLARQGALAFELWLGIPAPYDAMLAAIG